MEDRTIISTLDDLREGKVSVSELVKSYLERIEKLDSSLNAFITVTGEEALEQAKESEERYRTEDVRALEGIPIALKDLFLTKGVKTTAGSKVLSDYVGQYDGTVVKKLKDAGAIILGKANCDAWAHGSSGENSDFGATRNPYDTDYVPGGSSSGSPAAVAAGMVLAATGTDTGGSIRLPASFCNVVGLKPTYGRVSRFGVIAMASSLDSIGHFTKTVEESAYLLGVTAGHDSMDATTPLEVVPDYTESLHESIKGIRIGRPKEYFVSGLDPKVASILDSAFKFYEGLGAEIVDVSLPHTEYAISTYYILQTAEVSSNLGRYDGIRYGGARSDFGDEAKRRIMLGTYVLSSGYYDAYYKKGQQVRTLLREDFERAFEKVDVMLTPASPGLPFKLGAKTSDPLEMYLSDIFTVHANLVGIPGLVIPGGFVDKLPVGIQLLGRHFDELTLYKVAHKWEEANPFWKESPNLKK